MTTDPSRISQARRRAGRRLGFLIHAAVFAAVNLGLIATNVAAAPAHPWSAYPLLGWGLGLLMHGLATSGTFGRAYDSLVERELARLPAARDVQP